MSQIQKPTKIYVTPDDFKEQFQSKLPKPDKKSDTADIVSPKKEKATTTTVTYDFWNRYSVKGKSDESIKIEETSIDYTKSKDTTSRFGQVARDSQVGVRFYGEGDSKYSTYHYYIGSDMVIHYDTNSNGRVDGSEKVDTFLSRKDVRGLTGKAAEDALKAIHVRLYNERVYWDGQQKPEAKPAAQKPATTQPPAKKVK